MHLVVLFFFNLPEYGDLTFFLVPATPLKKPLIGHNGTQRAILRVHTYALISIVGAIYIYLQLSLGYGCNMAGKA